MAARDVWVSPRNEQEWDEFWNAFFNGEKFDENWNQEEKERYRKKRKASRVHKMRLVEKNEMRQKKGVKAKRISLYRLVSNGKNQHPSKPNPRRIGNFLSRISAMDYKSLEIEKVEAKEKKAE